MLGQGALFHFDRKQFVVHETPYLCYNCQLFEMTDGPMEFIHVRSIFKASNFLMRTTEGKSLSSIV